MDFRIAERRQEYLQTLRGRALARMKVDEETLAKPATVSRRDSLRWFGVAAVAAMAGVRPLRALTGGSGALGARAAMVGSVRSAAPQYGAPSWYAPRDPYAPPPVIGKVTNSRTELGDVKNWEDVWAEVASESKGKSSSVNGMNQVAAKEGYYSGRWGGGTHVLLAIADPDSKYAYIMRGRQSFYIVIGSKMYACAVGPGVLAIHGSLFREESEKDKLAEVIAGFTQVDDLVAYAKDRQGMNLNLEKGIPEKFWIRNEELGWVQNAVSVANVHRDGDALELMLRSDGYESTATFVIDLKAMKLVKTTFEGKEWTS